MTQTIPTCKEMQLLIPDNFEFADPSACIDAVVTENYSAFTTVDSSIKRHLETCQDCSNDLIWYTEIRHQCDVKTFPCLHMAYLCFRKLLSQEHGLYALENTTGEAGGIVIGFCPCCGEKLNTSLCRSVVAPSD